jgi:hypothetical protein
MERVDATVTSRWTTVAELLREFAVGGLAGVVSGFLVAGVAGRLPPRQQRPRLGNDRLELAGPCRTDMAWLGHERKTPSLATERGRT